MKCLLVIALSSLTLFAAEIPGGLSRTSEALPTNTYELLLAPSYTFKPNGAYLTSEIRYQPNEDFGAGFGFGAGEIGYNFGVNGTWYIVPDLGDQPAVSVLGGIYFNHMLDANYFNVRVAPMVSKTIRTDWGKVTPYGGLNLSPSFRLTRADNGFSMRGALGAQVDIKDLNGVLIFTEVDLGLIQSVHQISLGISYPFVAL